MEIKIKRQQLSVMVILISYATKPFYKSQQLLKQSALTHGVDRVIDYNDIWLRNETAFYQKNKSILSAKRGGGYWLWKPYILLDALEKMQDNDVLIHLDAGALIRKDVGTLVNLVQEKEIILFYNNGHKNKTWTKRDCFYYMNADSKEYYDADQLLAGYIVCRKTDFVMSLLREWLNYAEDERIISDKPNTCGLPNAKDFKDHRHDQSILSVLAKKYEIELFRDPSQWGNKYKSAECREEGEFLEGGKYLEGYLSNSAYPTIIDGHRNKIKLSFKDRISYFMLYFKKEHR